jgi:hypothetical protein
MYEVVEAVMEGGYDEAYTMLDVDAPGTGAYDYPTMDDEGGLNTEEEGEEEKVEASKATVTKSVDNRGKYQAL